MNRGLYSESFDQFVMISMIGDDEKQSVLLRKKEKTIHTGDLS